MTIVSDMRAVASTRRGFCLCCLVTAGLSASGRWLTPRQAFAQAQGIVGGIRAAAATAPITLHRLRGGIGMLEGSGGNIAVLSGRDGKLLVDSGITGSRPRIEEALETFGREPIRHLVNTHWHFDHSDGNEWIARSGATITAHRNTGKYLAMTQRVEDWDFDFPPAPRAALPTRVVRGEEVMRVNRATVTMREYGPGHTDSDLSVFFAEAEILHTGDTFWNDAYPFIDYSTGGSIDGTILATETSLAMSGPDTLVIPGHGPVGTRQDLRDFLDMLVDIRDRVTALKRQGRTLDEVIAARPTAAHDARWDGFVIPPPFFTRLVFAGV
ncbi:MBL fold metallo-hydrolase [Elioraea rosea]|uniref:MBL fold metallo-hydrolase n=1 Tax=Elioraea rosea TaxID=2492390 RepID=UPI00194FE4EF|nr:MBL fold metallo-hydrolase [Elioraea rosea]